MLGVVAVGVVSFMLLGDQSPTGQKGLVERGLDEPQQQQPLVSSGAHWQPAASEPKEEEQQQQEEEAQIPAPAIDGRESEGQQHEPAEEVPPDFKRGGLPPVLQPRPCLKDGLAGQDDNLQEKYFHVSEYAKIQSGIARLLVEVANHIIVAVFSTEMLQMTNNWLCSLASNRRTIDSASVLLFAIDGQCSGLSTGFQDAGGHFLCVAVHSKDPPAGSVVYASERYKFMCGAKLALFSWTMDAACEARCGLWILYSDVDVVIRGDVFDYLKVHVDLAELRDPHWPDEGPMDMVFQRSRPDSGMMNTGFYFAKAGSAARSILHGTLAYLHEDKTSDGADQGAMHVYLLDANSTDKVVIGLLPLDIFPTGAIYFHHLNGTPSKDWLALHANFLQNPSIKLTCLHLSGTLYVAQDAANSTCVVPRERQWHLNTQRWPYSCEAG